MKYSKRKGFTIIESIFYIGMISTAFLILLTFYKSYYSACDNLRKEVIDENNIRNFYINLDSIIRDEEIENIYIDNNALYIVKNTKSGRLNMAVKYYNKRVVIKYTRNNKTLTITRMLSDIDEFKVIKKNNLIYIYIKTLNEREYIRCI